MEGPHKHKPSSTPNPTKLVVPPLELSETELSKNQQKKLLKRNRALARKQERKQERRRERMAQAEREGRDLEWEAQQQVLRANTGVRRAKRQQLWESVSLPIAQAGFRIAIDCSFESLLRQAEIASLAKQIKYCYSYNKNCSQPVLWSTISLGPQTLTVLQKETGYDQWQHRGYSSTDKHLLDVYSQSDIVYLTSDAKTTLQTLQPSKVYVIGGIVDRNRLKGLAQSTAQQLQVQTAKLPLDDYLRMASTKVLTVNHVFHILLQYRQHGGDWERSFAEVLPSRKNAVYNGPTKSNDNPSTGWVE